MVVPPTVWPSGIGIADVADRERRAAAPVQLLLHRERAPGEVGAIEVAALLDEHDREPGLGELAPDDRAAGAGADHDDVALDREVAVEPVRGRGRACTRAWPRAFAGSTS